MVCSYTGCWPTLHVNTQKHNVTSPRFPTLTCTLCSCSECWPRRPSATLPWPGEEHTDLILCIRVEVPNLVTCWIHWLTVIPAATCCAVLHLSGNDGPIPVDGVGVELYPQVGCSHGSQLRWGNGNRWFWKANPRATLQTFWSLVFKRAKSTSIIKI